MIKVILRYGQRGGWSSGDILLNKKNARVLAHGLSFIFGREGEEKDWEINEKHPRVSWTSSEHFVSLELQSGKLDQLKKEAMISCDFRKHDMASFQRVGFNKTAWQSTCKKCGMIVTVKENPQPNDIDISGNAVALNCKGENHA